MFTLTKQLTHFSGYLIRQIADHDLEVERVDRDDGVGCVVVDDDHLHPLLDFRSVDHHGRRARALDLSLQAHLDRGAGVNL